MELFFGWRIGGLRHHDQGVFFMAEQNKSNLWLIIGAIVVVLAVIYWYMSGGTPEPTAPADTGAATTPAPAAETPAPADGAVSVEPATPATPAPATPAPEPAPAEPAPAGTTPPAN
ncbi:hypothetical protein ACO2Q4_02100 [Paracoccus sp. KR1-242]